MEISGIAVGAVCLLYVVATLFLEWRHHMTVIEERWPRLHKIIASRTTTIILALVGIGLFVEVLREYRSEMPKSEPSTKASVPPPRSGPATSSGPNSPANTGDGNTFVYGDNPKTTKPHSRK
jgi:hypothetical protein